MITKERSQGPLSPAKCARLDKIFQHAKKIPGDFDYAATLLLQCVTGNPANAEYVRAYIETLQKKYRNNGSGCALSHFKERPARNALKKAMPQQQWDEVIQHGIKILAVNPWDTSVLIAMGTAAGKLGHRPCELYYLQMAVAASPKDPICNRLYAMALSDRGMTDQAIVFWHRVEEILPDDHDAKLAIAGLTMQKANARGDFSRLDPVSSKLNAVAKQQEEATRLQSLQQKMQAEPQNMVNYLELAHLHFTNEQYEEAQEVLRQAYEASGGDLDVREKWEDAQLRRLRQKVLTAEKPADKQDFQREYSEKDLECCLHRVERYPDNLRFKFELGYRYLLARRYVEAIQQLQVAVKDPHKAGVALLLLGQCFQHVKQYRLAMSHYESAVAQIPERDANNRKSALYLAGRLALALKDVDTARKHLMALADLDFGYKDVASLLDGIPYQSTCSEDEGSGP